MIYRPKTEAELKAQQAEFLVKEPLIRALVAGLSPDDQIAVLLGTYINAARDLGLTHQAGMLLMEMGGSIVMKEMMEQAARSTSPASAEVDHHAPPPTVQ